jgi:L-aspartate oxidase
LQNVVSSGIQQARLDDGLIRSPRQLNAHTFHLFIIAQARQQARRVLTSSVFPMPAARLKAVPTETDFVVVGAGVAGLRGAIELAEAGRVLVLAKNELTESATQYAQGGIAVALSDEDDIGLHLQDTLQAGDGLSNPEAAKALVEDGPLRIQELIEWGTAFDRQGSTLTFTREGAHSRSRVLHAHGDSTGREIGRALHAKARRLKSISFCDFEFISDLWLHEGRVRGIELVGAAGETHRVSASAVLLATGGLGQIYRETTNPPIATGDGVAMAFRAGAEISDMEFIQFHPTALYVKGTPRFLISEALRGEGAYLRNMEMMRFMPKYHEMAELAPRDVVARAIVHEIERSGNRDAVVYLDMTHLDGDRVQARFPRIYATCLKYNIDLTTDMIPVRPAAHYAMGGVRTDLEGRTNIAGLFAAGEVACTGVHGANRLASNSLLEGVVFGARAGKAMCELAGKITKTTKRASGKACDGTADYEQVLSQVRELMWKQVGIVRNGKALRLALDELKKLNNQLFAGCNRRAQEARNVMNCALLVARSALAREESRGAHYRLDFPAHDDARFKKHSIVQGDNIRFE